jgi:hypothetical protein
MPNILSNWASLILAISIAAERFVAIFKTIAPNFANDKLNPDGTTNLKDDRFRRLTIQFVAFIGGWIACSMIAYASDSKGSCYLLWINFGGRSVVIPIIALLASGGSAVWGSIVQFSSAAKDVQNKIKVGMVPANDATKTTP